MLKLFGNPNDVDSDKLELNTRVQPFVRIINGALDESDDSTSSLILHGRIDPATLHFLKVDEYQRPLADRADLFAAMKDGKVTPFAEIGVRGQDFITDGDDFVIRSPAYIIDGWQRIGTAMRLLEAIPNHPLRIFASVHFGTSRQWESERFVDLNKNVKRVSPNIHLRNMRESNEAILVLYNITAKDGGSPLFKRVSWDQNAHRGEIVSAMNLAIAIHFLHTHRVGFRQRTADSVAAGLARIAKAVTPPTFRKNIHTFINLIDECWPLSGIEYRIKAPQVKSAFLYELARMLSKHQTFWEHNDNTLTISADDRRKLAKFRVTDSQVQQLAGSGGAARQILYRLLVDHMNSGRRTQRLRSRDEND